MIRPATHRGELLLTIAAALAVSLLVCFIILLFVLAASARWEAVADRWEAYQLTPAQKDWFAHVSPGRGRTVCCSTADGIPADDWERRADPDMTTHYWVRVTGQWLKVPDEAVVTDSDNPVGVPVVWFSNGSSSIRCFVPGPEN